MNQKIKKEKLNMNKYLYVLIVFKVFGLSYNKHRRKF